ncbi:hypothetical protein GGH92_002983, partial [Coemansia sp. RSA 2673]
MAGRRKHQRPESGRPNGDAPPQKMAKLIDHRQEQKDEEASMTVDDIYFEEGGLQRIHPYFFKFTTYAKGRW